MKNIRIGLIVFIVFLFLCSVITVILYDKRHFIFGSDIRLFGYLFLSGSLFFSGFLYLIAYFNKKNMWFNLMMVIILCSTGIMNIAISMWQIISGLSGKSN